MMDLIWALLIGVFSYGDDYGSYGQNEERITMELLLWV
jgi:hypothetical protein